MGSQVYQVSQVNQDLQDIPHTVQGWAALCTITFRWYAAGEIIHREKRTNTVSLTRGRVFFSPGHRIADGRSLGWQNGTSSHDKWHQGNTAVGIHSQQLAKWSLHFQKNQCDTVKLIFRRGFTETPCCYSCSIFFFLAGFITRHTNISWECIWILNVDHPDLNNTPRENWHIKLDIKECKSAGAQKKQSSEKLTSTISTESVWISTDTGWLFSRCGKS